MLWTIIGNRSKNTRQITWKMITPLSPDTPYWKCYFTSDEILRNIHSRQISFSLQIKSRKYRCIKHELHKIQSNLICITLNWSIPSPIPVLQLIIYYGKKIFVFWYSEYNCSIRTLDSRSCNSRHNWLDLHDCTIQSWDKAWNQVCMHLDYLWASVPVRPGSNPSSTMEE